MARGLSVRGVIEHDIVSNRFISCHLGIRVHCRGVRAEDRVYAVG